jgi:hypothetical protein
LIPFPNNARYVPNVYIPESNILKRSPKYGYKVNFNSENIDASK